MNQNYRNIGTAVKAVAVFICIYTALLVSVNAQNTIHKYITIYEGQTGTVSYMDTLFYDNFNSGSIECWDRYKANDYVNDFAPATSITYWGNPSYSYSAYNGYSMFAQVWTLLTTQEYMITTPTHILKPRSLKLQQSLSGFRNRHQSLSDTSMLVTI